VKVTVVVIAPSHLGSSLDLYNAVLYLAGGKLFGVISVTDGCRYAID
jgi:hypothetical protein